MVLKKVTTVLARMTVIASLWLCEQNLGACPDAMCRDRMIVICDHPSQQRKTMVEAG